MAVALPVAGLPLGGTSLPPVREAVKVKMPAWVVAADNANAAIVVISFMVVELLLSLHEALGAS